MATKKQSFLLDPDSRPDAAATPPSAHPASAPPSSAPVARSYPFIQLDDVIGQDSAIATLRTAIDAGRLHHAWIFHGPQGVGKLTTAVAFAAYLLDTALQPDLAGRVTPDPDGITQRLIRAGTHPDLHVVTKELAAISRDTKIRGGKQISIPKEVIQEFLTEPAVRTRVQIGPSIAGKVFIIDEAELLNHYSQNLLLKTLEEPPPGTIIILITSGEDRLFSTIRSRCQRVRFSSLTNESMRAWIKRHAVASTSPEHDAWLLQFAAGSPGMLELALHNNLLTWHDALTPLLAGADRGRYSSAMGPTMHHLVESQAAAWVKKFPDASKDAANKAWAKRLLGYLSEHYRDQLSRATSAGNAALARLITSIDAVAQAEEHLNTNVNMQFVFENLAVKLCAERRV